MRLNSARLLARGFLALFSVHNLFKPALVSIEINANIFLSRD